MALTTRELAALPLFAGTPSNVVDALARRATEVRFAPNEVIFLTGSQPRGWFIILEGTVRVVRGSEGRQHVIHTETTGGTLAEVPLVENGTHPATAVAQTPTRCALLTRQALENAIAEQPAVAFLIARRLAARVRLLVDRLDSRSARTVDSRLAAFLLTRRSASPEAFTLGSSQQALAEELGTVREVVVRTLRRFRQQGLIEPAGRGRYRVRDAGGLTRIAASPPARESD